MAEVGQNLESWKEIASFLKRGVRTVQRWEREEGLPVHRHQHGKRGTVFALPKEIQSWQSSREDDGTAGREAADAELRNQSPTSHLEATSLLRLCMLARERAEQARQSAKIERAGGNGGTVPRKPLDTRIGAVDLEKHMQHFERLCELSVRQIALVSEVKALLVDNRRKVEQGGGRAVR